MQDHEIEQLVNETGGFVHPRPISMIQTDGNNAEYKFETGLTLRDHFAGLAMQAIIAKTDLEVITGDEESDTAHANVGGAYYYADLMIAARKEQS